jgi:putative transposase
MQSWKRLSSYDVRLWYRQHSPHYLSDQDAPQRFWTPKYYAFEIYSHDKLDEKLHYMHLNPVRAGFVERAVDWKWSSARWYEERRTVGVPIHWVD